VRNPIADLYRATGVALGRHPRDRAALDAYRARHLRRVVRHAYDAVPFYRRLFDGAGVHPDRIRDVADLQALPIVSKQDLRTSPAADTIARGCDPERLFERWTSGSTGQPFLVRKSWLDQQIQGAFRYRSMRDYRMRWGDRHAMVMFHFPERRSKIPQIGAALARAGLYHQTRIDCTAPEATILQGLRRLQPDIISGYPSALVRVAEWVARNGKTAPRPRFVVTDSEQLTPMARQLLRTVFAAPVYDLYDCFETNMIAWQCPRLDLLHICEDAVIVEVLREGRPAAMGESGEVVITALFARATPYIRYRIGDIATLGPAPCPCGQLYGTLKAVQGRVADFFKLSDGRMAHPYALAGPLLRQTWIGRFQLVQHGQAQFVAKVVPIGKPTMQELDRAEAALAALSAEYGVAIRLALVDDIPVGAGGKHQPYVPFTATETRAE